MSAATRAIGATRRFSGCVGFGEPSKNVSDIHSLESESRPATRPQSSPEDQSARSRRRGCDLHSVGTIWSSHSKDCFRPLGVQSLRTARRASSLMPVASTRMRNARRISSSSCSRARIRMPLYLMTHFSNSASRSVLLKSRFRPALEGSDSPRSGGSSSLGRYDN